jgi:two-component system cell cycle response regulator
MSEAIPRILLIDDDRLQQRMAEEHFKRFKAAKYLLDWAQTYEDGITRLLSGKYAACLLDYQLGGRDGLELIREAVAKGCSTPIVFLTAEQSEHIDIQAMNAGALDYLVKGEITPRVLERSLRYALKLGETLGELRRLATRDQLTGLLNRREFDRILAEECDRAVRFGRPVALLIVDLDHFKRVNDVHGHPAGDAVLREAARRLADEVRSVDRATRFGGEEFAIVLMEMDRTQAMEVARRMCRTMAATPIEAAPGVLLNVTMSVGVAVTPSEAKDPKALVAAADRALYAAKAGGRNRAVAFGELET